MIPSHLKLVEEDLEVTVLTVGLLKSVVVEGNGNLWVRIYSC